MSEKNMRNTVLAFSLIVLFSFSAWAVPGLINYQGELTDKDGNLLEGRYHMRFRLYTSESDPSFMIWSEEQMVMVTDGIYSVQLGSVEALTEDQFSGDHRYLEIAIDDKGTWEVLSPRQRLTSAAFSLKAGDAETLGGEDASFFAEAVHRHDFSEFDGTASDAQIPNNITIDYAATAGTASSAEYATVAGDADRLDSYDSSAFSPAGHSHNGSDITSGTVAAAFIDDAITQDTEMTAGLAGKSDVGHTHDGIYYSEGEADARFVNVTVDSMQASTSGSVLTSTNTGSGNALSGHAQGGSGKGVYGNASNMGDVENYGGYFESAGRYGAGVYGKASHSYGGRGVYGKATGDAGIGVYGENSGSIGAAVYGRSTSSAYGKGGYFEAEGSDGIGVYAVSSSGFAGYFEGNIKVSGSGNGIVFPDGTVQTTAGAPTWHQKLSGSQRFELVLDGDAVLDKETGLVWEQSPATTKRNWIAACIYCYEKTVADRMGWRLPTVEELASLLDKANMDPALTTDHPFSDVISSNYWSSSTFAGDNSFAWTVHFLLGQPTQYGDKSNGNYYVWCVRGGHGHDAY